MLQKKGYELITSIFGDSTITKLKNVFVKSFKDNVDENISSFEDIINYPIESSTDLTAFNKDIIYSKQLFDIVNSSEIISIVKDHVDHPNEYSLHQALNVRIQFQNNEKSNHKFSKYLGWHQDVYTMGDDSIDTPIYTLWIPLTKCDLISGGLDLFNADEKIESVLPFDRSNYLTTDVDLLKGRGVNIECVPGDVVIFDKFLIHKSRPNYSNMNRVSLDIRIFKTGMPSGRGNLPTYQIKEYSNDITYQSWIKEIRKYV